MIDERIQENSVIQINEIGPDGWEGCLMQVDKVAMWGVMATMQIPRGGTTAIRLEWPQFEYVGEAPLESE